MTTAVRNLWPEDLKTADLRTANEILSEQARLLEQQTNGVLTGETVEHAVQDRRVLSFDVNAPRIPTTIRLFEVHQPLEMDYPVRIVPPKLEVPEYLHKKVYRPGLAMPTVTAAIQGTWEERQWVAESPGEFTEKLEKLLASTTIKAILFNLLSRSQRAPSGSAPPSSPQA